MSMHSVDDLRSVSSPAVVDEQALLDAQARLALAVAALDGAAEALIEAGLPAGDCESIDRSKEHVEVMQRMLAARLDRVAATVRRSAAISDLVEADRIAATPPPPPPLPPARPTSTAPSPCSSARAGSAISRPRPAAA